MDLQVFSDQNLFLGMLKNRNESIYDKVRPLVLASPLDNPVNVHLNATGFILMRRSNLSMSRIIGRRPGLIISSVGYVDLPDSAARILRLARYMDIHDLYERAGKWTKGAAHISAIYYKDSPVSGFIARRVFDNNNFARSEITQAGIDAEWRAQNNGSANPTLINGSSEEYEEYTKNGKRKCVNF